MQRFDSALRLNPHAHALALYDVYVHDQDGRLEFHPLLSGWNSRLPFVQV